MNEAFFRIAELAQALKVPPLNQHEGCWTHQVDERWWIAVNGHREPRGASSPKGMSAGMPYNVQPFECCVEYNGWLAGTFSPAGGVLAAGEGANEDTFIAAVVAATERAKQGTNQNSCPKEG